MNVELEPGEAEVLKTMLQAEVETKRVELHRARNIDFKAELQKQEKVLQDLLRRIP